MRFVVRCEPLGIWAAPSIQLPTERKRAWTFASGLLLKLARLRPGEFLELAWIVRKKPIWSPS